MYPCTWCFLFHLDQNSIFRVYRLWTIFKRIITLFLQFFSLDLESLFVFQSSFNPRLFFFFTCSCPGLFWQGESLFASSRFPHFCLIFKVKELPSICSTFWWRVVPSFVQDFSFCFISFQELLRLSFGFFRLRFLIWFFFLFDLSLSLLS